MMITTRFQKVIDALKAAGSKVNQHSNTNYQAQCPAHDDKNPSLSVGINDEGEIGLKCHAGCETSDILKALELRWSLLFPDDGNKGGKKNSGKIVKTYPYRDEEGNLLFEVVRKQPKAFLQRQPEVGGGWKWTSKGTRKVLYNLPKIKEAIEADRPIFLVEGEKDADALTKRGLIATTCPMGADNWRDEYNEMLERSNDLIIIPDNDIPGKKHAANVTGALIDKVRRVRILQLQGLSTKEDVSDWLMKGGTKDELLDLAFNTEPVKSEAEAKTRLDIKTEIDENDPRNVKSLFFEEDLKLYANEKDERLIADFVIDIESIVKDAREGKIFYIKIKEKDRGHRRVSETIEIKPEYLDDVRSFYKAIRPYSMGEIIYYRRQNKVKPLTIFKWLLQNFEKPIVRRPDHVGHTKVNGRPFWIFGNALICPPWKGKDSKIVTPNEAGEYIVDEKLGFTLPLYENEMEKEQIVPFVNTNIENMGTFLGELKTKIIELIGGGDPSDRAPNFGKILLGYVIYHLYEQQLYNANDINGHTVMLYVYGPKGTGKTTYFNTLLRAFFGLHKTKEIKGNSVSIPSIENTMGMYSQLPVCYDEFNPEHSNVKYNALNGYYHRTSRSVSDVDRKNRNKFTPIRSTLSITSNYRINLDKEQADATESRMIYFQYKKEFRSEDNELFKWFEDNLDKLSGISTYLLMNQTDEKRREVRQKATELYQKMKKLLDQEVEAKPNKYSVEHRLTDNYTRLLAAYEIIFGRDDDFRRFIFEEILNRFAAARSNDRERALLLTLAYLGSSGRIKEFWHYQYNQSKKELHIHLGQCYQTYREFKGERAKSLNQFREIITDYFDECGGYETGSPRWYGSYLNSEKERQEVNKTRHSYIISFSQVKDNPMLKDVFPPNEDQAQELTSEDDKKDDRNRRTSIDLVNLDDPPF